MFYSTTSLKNLEKIEILFFEATVKTLLNTKDGVLVIDDELIPSRAKDVELKTVSNRKSGKEGPVADCMACSLLGIMYGMKLRSSGVSQVDNVVALASSIPKINQNVSLTFDRGYGKRSFSETMISRGFNISTFASTTGSRHPFVSPEEVFNFERKLLQKGASQEMINARISPIRKWIFNEGDYLGSEIRVASVGVSNRKQLFASIVREVFDRKSTKKSLRFFLSGIADNSIPLIGTTWVCISLGERISNETLLYGDNWEEKEVVEKALLQNCNPLSIGQRCADWFLLRTFHFTGTLGSGLGSLDRNVTNENLRVVMDSLLDSWYKRVSSTSA